MKYKKGDIVVRLDNETETGRIIEVKTIQPDGSTTYWVEELTGIDCDPRGWWNTKYFKKITKLEQVLK